MAAKITSQSTKIFESRLNQFNSSPSPSIRAPRVSETITSCHLRLKPPISSRAHAFPTISFLQVLGTSHFSNTIAVIACNYCILLSILNPMVPPMQANIVSKASGTTSTAPSVRFAKGGWMNFTAKTMDDPGMAVGYARFQGLRKAGIWKTKTHQSLQLLPILSLYWLLLFTP